MNMRPLWRSLLLVFVLWFALSPTLCFASETVTNSTYSLQPNTFDVMTLEEDEQVSLLSVTDDDVANGLVQADFLFMARSSWTSKYVSNPFVWSSPMELSVFEFSSGCSTIDQLNSSDYKSGFGMYVRLNSVDGSVLLDSGDSASLKVSGLKHQMKYNYHWSWSSVNVGGGSGGGVAYYPIDANKIDMVTLQVQDVNGNFTFVSYKGSELDDKLIINGDTFGFECDIQPPSSDVKRIDVIFYWPLSAYNWSVPDASEYHTGGHHDYGTGIYFQGSVHNGVLKISPPDESTGLLKGIIEWLRSIRDGIVNVGTGVTNVFNSILELPAKLWNLIETGLKNLFVPSETAIASMKDKWDTLLADRFGVVYESGALVIDIANSVSEASTSETITFPSVSYNFSGTDFTFGGYEVDVIPNGFEFLADILKGVLDIVCTLAFINAMRRKYDELMMR